MVRKANMPLSAYLNVKNGATPKLSNQTFLNIIEAMEIPSTSWLTEIRQELPKGVTSVFCTGTLAFGTITTVKG